MKVDLLGPDESLEGYARAIARAFVGYPVMQRAFCDSPGKQEDWIYEMVLRSGQARQEVGMRIPVMRDGNVIAAGANLHIPEADNRPTPRDWFTEFLSTAGPSALEFFPRFIDAVSSIELPQPSAYLYMIGVDPSYQGKGVGKALIDYCLQLANENPANRGIGLDTQDEKNVDIYRRCGFTVVDEKRLDDMPIYFLWRERSES